MSEDIRSNQPAAVASPDVFSQREEDTGGGRPATDGRTRPGRYPPEAVACKGDASHGWPVADGRSRTS